MKKTSIIELNALLDVILLLIFVFILNMNMSSSKKDEEVNKVKAKNEQLLQENKKINTSIDNLAKGISRFLDLNDEEMKSLLTTSGNMDDKHLMEQLSKMINEKDIIKQLEKYETISKKFFYVEVEIATNKNRLYINKQATNVYITKQEINDSKLLNNKKEQIKDEIENEINNRDGGYSMILISLAIADEEVYQYAYEVVWDSIKELENKYGTQKFFKTELSFVRG